MQDMVNQKNSLRAAPPPEKRPIYAICLTTSAGRLDYQGNPFPGACPLADL